MCRILSGYAKSSSVHFTVSSRYDVFTIDMPILQYKVMVSLFEYNGVLGSTESGEIVANWTLLSSFELSPSKTVSRSPDGRVSNLLVVSGSTD